MRHVILSVLAIATSSAHADTKLDLTVGGRGGIASFYVANAADVEPRGIGLLLGVDIGVLRRMSATRITLSLDGGRFTGIEGSDFAPDSELVETLVAAGPRVVQQLGKFVFVGAGLGYVWDHTHHTDLTSTRDHLGYRFELSAGAQLYQNIDTTIRLELLYSKSTFTVLGSANYDDGYSRQMGALISYAWH